MDHERVLAWAEQQLEALKTSIETVYDQQPTAFMPDHSLVTNETTVRFIKRRFSEEENWPFMVGDVVHNLRVSLDYLARKLVPITATGVDERQIAFPIAGPRTNYGSLEGKCIPGANQEVKKIIKRLQPDYGRTVTEFQPLLALDELENTHKHRRLLLTDIGVTSVTQIGASDKIKLTFAAARNGPIKDRAEVYRYTILDSSHRPDDVQIRVATHVFFDEPGRLAGLKVVRVLEDIRDFIRHVVFRELKGYT